jgi:arsenate reductase (glutaredoxin)
MATVTIYGLPNCDTTKLGMAWLKKNGHPFVFHDYKLAGITAAKLQAWCQQVDWTTLLNKKSTTWRSLSPEEQASAVDQAGAIALMVRHTNLVKRPVLEYAGGILVGFNAAAYEAWAKGG